MGTVVDIDKARDAAWGAALDRIATTMDFAEARLNAARSARDTRARRVALRAFQDSMTQALCAGIDALGAFCNTTRCHDDAAVEQAFEQRTLATLDGMAAQMRDAATAYRNAQDEPAREAAFAAFLTVGDELVSLHTEAFGEPE